MDVNPEVHIVDREDQALWYLDTSTAHSFCIQLDNNRKQLRDWLCRMTQKTVVVSGQGVLPPAGGMVHPTSSIYQYILRTQFKVYFEDERDAIAFKLAWGGSL